MNNCKMVEISKSKHQEKAQNKAVIQINYNSALSSLLK